MGHHEGSGGTQRKILLLLRGALPRHHLQHHLEEEDPLLHCEPHHPLRGDIVSIHTRVLPTIRLRGEGLALHLDPPVSHCVLFAAGRDHSSHFHNSASAR